MVYLNLDCSTIEEEIIAADGIVEEYIVFDSMLVPTVVAAILKSRHVSICIYIYVHYITATRHISVFYKWPSPLSIVMQLCLVCRVEDEGAYSSHQQQSQRRRHLLPPVTPNACVRDTVSSQVFDQLWTEVRTSKLPLSGCSFNVHFHCFDSIRMLTVKYSQLDLRPLQM